MRPVIVSTECLCQTNQATTGFLLLRLLIRTHLGSVSISERPIGKSWSIGSRGRSKESTIRLAIIIRVTSSLGAHRCLLQPAGME